jgi:nucleotide-binding universal stress UspA family protein
MAMKDILVHLDATAASAARLDVAAGLAQRLGAHLVGLFVVDIPLPVFAGGDVGGGAVTAELLTQLRDSAVADAARIAPTFQERLRRDGISGEWREAEGSTPPQVALHGRYADLVVVGQSNPDGGNPAAEATVEAALFTSGRPVLVVPYTWKGGTVGQRALLGWNASREAARAVNDALPLLQGAANVTVLTINATATPGGHGEQPGADIALHLARHGLKVTVRHVDGADIGAGDLILNEAADLQADLIVMGGYGHSRLRELVLGGATRTILKQMTAPVLLSH